MITIKAVSDNYHLTVEVKDTGCGIDESEMDRLFQPYNRIESDHAHFSGLGLGLALCKPIIDLHAGKIWISSQKGKGSTSSPRGDICHIRFYDIIASLIIIPAGTGGPKKNFSITPSCRSCR